MRLTTLHSVRRALSASGPRSTTASSIAGTSRRSFLAALSGRQLHASRGALSVWRTARRFHTTPLLAFNTPVATTATSALKPSLSLSPPAPRVLPPTKKNQLNWNVHEEITISKTPLSVVFERLQEEVAMRGLTAKVRRVVDVFYFYCAQQADDLPMEFRSQVAQYFDETLLFRAKTFAPKPHNECLNEGVFAMVVQLHLSLNDKPNAWRIAVHEQLQVTGKQKVHFRSIGPILEYECQNDQFLEALARWKHVKNDGMEWTKNMEDTLVQMVIACQRHYSGSKAGSPAFKNQLQVLVRDLGLATKEISAANALRLRQAFEASGFVVESLLLGSGSSGKHDAAVCNCCGALLQKHVPSKQENHRLLKAIEDGVSLKNPNKNASSSATSSTKEFLLPFKRWLTSKHAQATRLGKLHYILDGPNIAYLNQNFDNGSFRLDHIDKVVRLLQKQGHEVSITIPQAYLEESSLLHIRTTRTKEMRRQGKVMVRKRSPQDTKLIEKWLQQNLLFSCRTESLSDDIFWLYGSALLGQEVRIVTNDRGRDHVFTLQNQRTTGMTTAEVDNDQCISIDLLDRWRDAAIVNIAIQHGEPSSGTSASTLLPVEHVQLFHPAPFSRVPQLTEDLRLHFPVSSTSATETTTAATPTDAGSSNSGSRSQRWLCIQPPPPTKE